LLSSPNEDIAPMPAVEWYHRKIEECVALAKAARLDEERARLYALAEYYIRLATEVAQGETARLKELTRKTYAHASLCEARLLR
jgi:hypothetical protein